MSSKVKDDRERQFQHESLQDREAIATYLETLREGFESGYLTFSDERGELSLEPHGLVGFEVRVSRKRDRVRLTVRCSWKDGVPAEAVEVPGLKIRAGRD